MSSLDELPGHVLDLLRSDARTCDLPNLETLAAVVADVVRDAAKTELFMAAGEAQMCVTNYEHPWSQGVMFVVEQLRDRAAGRYDPDDAPRA